MELETSATTIGHRLRTARAAMGLSTRDIALKLRDFGILVSHTTIGNYERGVTDVPATVLTAVSKLYNRSVTWLLGDGGAFSNPRYRALKKTVGDHRAAFEAAATGYAELYLTAEDRLSRQLSNCPIEVREQESAEDVAAKMRRELDLGASQPIRSVIWLLERVGIRVFTLRAPDGIDAFAATFQGRAFVVLNSNLTPDRMRLTAAHELGHHLFHDCVKSQQLSESELETRAFDLGGTLLLPPDVLTSAMEYRSIVRMVQFKERYGISLAAMIVRAKKAGLIPASTYERLWKDFSRMGWRKPGAEPGTVQLDRPTRLEVLVDSAIKSSKLTIQEASEIARVTPREIETRLAIAMGEDPDLYLDQDISCGYSFERHLLNKEETDKGH